jgi:L-threonine kinase
MRWSELADRTASSGCASCHGSFGELLQGALPEHGAFLVTLPIELRARARFVVHERSRELHVRPASSWKSLRLAEVLLRRYDLPLRGELTLAGEIARGKGLASSTADLVASYRAITSFHRLPQEIEVLEALLREIEPSDGVMHESVVAYRHREARLLERLGPVPPLALVAIDEGGEVGTLAHNRVEPAYSREEIDEFAALLARLRQAFGHGAPLRMRPSHRQSGEDVPGRRVIDLAAIGAVATRSAEMNQRILPKRSLATMIEVAAAVDAVGVVGAHSGTCLAILIDALRHDRDDRIQAASERLMALGFQPTTLVTLHSRWLPESVHV